MKKLLIEFLKKHFKEIASNWSAKLKQLFKDKLSDSQIETFTESSLLTFIDVLEEGDYKIADLYLIEIYTLCSNLNMSLIDVSQLFSQGRYAILNIIETEQAGPNDPIILLGFVDEIIEQLFARYSMLHQEAKMNELKYDRDRLASKLELSQQYLKNILHTSDSAIMMVDENEKFIAWNKGAERIFGYTEEEIIGKPSSFLLPEGKKYQDELKKIQKEVKEGATKILETERRTKDGRILSVKLSVSKLPGSNGGYAGRSIIIKDFTEFKKLQAQIDQSEKLAVIGQLAAGVAHEIGNPLASISSLVQILQRKSKDPFFTEQLSNIKENIDRISKIVRELVDFSRPPSYEKSMSDISDIIKTALGIVKYDKRVKKVKFETDLKESLPRINVATDQILQVFVNILINALDAIEGNGRITVKSDYDDDFIYVHFSDDGCGMDENTLKQIFDPFFTTKEVGKGTGLGLSVSYGIIKQYNGEITVKSKLNEGSTFTVKIPIKENTKSNMR
ncbi:two-component system sensor histidine kinase NtrB [Melioribacter sp. OK-6-Me]|uniref:two-component system sensor histidine kinase NtrB n=1 Tax=unclassified Melioribacter TaxID=2627329 RepID=UPI003EDAF61C